MAALLARRRLGTPDAKSVDQLAQVEQITEPAEIVESVIGIDWRRASKRLRLLIGPARRNQRPTAIRPDCEEIAGRLMVLMTACADSSISASRTASSGE
ncbi:hypothetical protein ACVSQB_40805 [Bradyrhizobium elkanii]